MGINWKLMMCAIFGHRMKWANGGIDGIAGARDCTRCGLHEPAIVWDKAPPMPTCKPPRTEQADRIQVLISLWERNAKMRFECADRTEDKVGKRTMNSSAFVYFNCAQALKEATGQAASEYDVDTFKPDVNAEAIARLDAHNLT